MFIVPGISSIRLKLKKIQFSCLMFVFGKKVASAEQSLKCVKFKLVKLVTNELVKLVTYKLIALCISWSIETLPY